MRNKKDSGRVAKSQPISLLPHHHKFLIDRSEQAGMTPSRYIQKLLEHDKANNILADILRADADRVSVAA